MLKEDLGLISSRVSRVEEYALYYVSQINVEIYCFADGMYLFKQPRGVYMPLKSV